MSYDFSGYATKNNLLCADGRVIRQGAFQDNDGQTVPLVWHHVHSDPTNVLGHALLENRDDGVYAYGTFNNTEKGRHAKELVKNGDVTALSIFANRLEQQGNNVIHGMIREVSLVLSGANPGAFIDNISFAHSDSDGEVSYTESADEAVIYSGLEQAVYFQHADDEDNQNGSKKKEDSVANKEKTVGDVFDELTDEQKDAVYFLIGQALEENGKKSVDDEDVDEAEPPKQIKHADDEPDDAEDTEDTGKGKTIKEIFDSLTDEQKDAVYFIVGQAVDDATNSGNNVEHDDIYGDDFMKHNVFDETYNTEAEVLSHDEFEAIMADAGKTSSLKDVFLAHGITNLDILFPEARSVTPTPDMIARPTGWVDTLWNGIKRTPFSRIKSIAANITGDEARARGYVKTHQKVDEVITMLSRETTPQTIYKKQKLDRDDVVDITDIDVIAWLKQEMRLMLNEEICRAILVGDGRNVNSGDKIKEDRIRPIYKDDDVYTIHYEVTYASGDTADQKASKLVDAAVRARKDYKGSGTPMFFATNEVIADLLLAKDTIGRRLFKDEDELKSALRVSKIVEVPVMEGVQRTTGTGGSAKTFDLKAIIVNPSDYTVGADKGGAVSLFDDFDIDYNQMKYLIETRCSGALTHPYSAIALEVQNF